ncbi:MAG: hypothetical protein VCA55_15040 [Verrucomicrobiales bacterium]
MIFLAGMGGYGALLNNKAKGEGLNQRNSLLLPAGFMEPLVRVFVFIGERISGRKYFWA